MEGNDLRQQCRSQIFKPGEALDHFLAVDKVFWFLNNNKREQEWIIDKEVPLTYTPEFKKQLPKVRTFNGHTGDLGIYEPIYHEGELRDFNLLALIEINGNIGFYYRHPVTGKVKRGTATKHSKANQIRNDKIVKNYLEEYHPSAVYKVLLKEEVLGDCGKNGKDEEYKTATIRHLFEELKEWVRDSS